jgi:hypothetical protein
MLLTSAINGRSGQNHHADWQTAMRLAWEFAVLWFIIYFVLSLMTGGSVAGVDEILDRVESDDKVPVALTGFVAMEYYALIMNRTFVVFVSPDGLYGWKAVGAVAGGAAGYYQPFQELLADSNLMHDLIAIKKLAALAGGFFIPKGQIRSAEAVPQQKFGMAGIPHSGRILIHFVSGGSREFIPLGSVDGASIARSILA